MIIHMNRRGFTIVELIIVISIMGILLTLGVVNLRGSQANGRDAERKVDIETIAQHLETYYTSGTDNSTAIGTYPSTALTSSSANMVQILRDIDIDSITAPGLDDGDDDKAEHAVSTFIPATDTTPPGLAQPTTTATIVPQPTKDQYVYQPLHSDGTLCNDALECRKFNLYYRLEVDNTVNMVTSINQ